MIRAQAHLACERIELGLFFRRLDQAAGFSHFRRVLLDKVRLVRLAALARTEACCLSLGRGLVKADMGAFRPPRWAGWPTIDACGLDCDIELTIAGSIARDKGFPSLVIEGRCGGERQLLGSWYMPHGLGPEVKLTRR
jgi:hypothetical protein